MSNQGRDQTHTRPRMNKAAALKVKEFVELSDFEEEKIQQTVEL